MKRVLGVVVVTIVVLFGFNTNKIIEASNNSSKDHVVTFDPNNGEDPIQIKVDNGKELSVSDVPFEELQKEELDFLGWFYGDNNNYEVIFPLVITDDLTLKAKWGKHVPPNPESKPGYRMIFGDDFSNEDGILNSNLWVDKYLSSWTRTPQRAKPVYELKDNKMSLQIKEETEPWSPEYDGATVVSGFSTGNRNALHNWNKTNQVRNPVETELTHINQYGYYEMRAKAQAGSSRHAAWWLLGFEDSKEESAEIDIFEILGNDPNGIPRAFHGWNDEKAFQEGASGSTYEDSNANFHDEWHVYGMDWQEGEGSGNYPDKLVFYVDGKEVGSENVDITYPMIQMFSLYEKREGGWTGPWEWMPYPNSFDIDYVRVYKKLPEDQKELSNDQLNITKIEDSSVEVKEGEASLKTYTSKVEDNEGEEFVEPNLPDTKSYVNVTWNDGVVTQEFVKWDPVTEEDIEQINSGKEITKKGSLPDVDMNGASQPVLNIEVIPQPDNVTSVSELKKLVEYHNEEGHFDNEESVHDLEIHLTALEHYEKKNEMEKSVKHLNGFKKLLEHQKEKTWISEETYENLLSGTNTLLDIWDK